MPQPWTSKLIIKALGVAKCNGSLDAATEDISLEKIIGVAKEKAGQNHLTGADLKALAVTRSHWYLRINASKKLRDCGQKDALRVIENGEWDERFN